MFDTDIESSEAILFNKNFLVNTCWLLLTLDPIEKNEKIAIFPNFKENSK